MNKILITEEYRKLNEYLHKTRKNWGSSGSRFVNKVIELSKEYNTQNILDYGCGSGKIQKGLPFQITQYDPAIPEHSRHPKIPHDIVICTDVLEHIEPELIDNVLDDLLFLTNKIILLWISTRKAHAILPDGRNAHLIVENKDWWLSKIEKRFIILEQRNSNTEYYILGSKIVDREREICT